MSAWHPSTSRLRRYAQGRRILLFRLQHRRCAQERIAKIARFRSKNGGMLTEERMTQIKARQPHSRLICS